jgi:hypothetical protein
MSDSEKNPKRGRQDLQVAFVVLLGNFKLLFDGRQTHSLNKQKEIVGRDLPLIYLQKMKKEK